MASRESKTESKKSKKQRDAKEDNQSTKRRSESDKNETVAVHSANSWEKVDLGGDERKSKFLRLMGASKKEHHGRFVIGENRTEHGRSKEDVEKLTEDLEEQYEQGMGLVLSGAARQHKGLGFQEANDEDQNSKGDQDLVPEEPTPTPDEKPEEEEERPKKKKSKKDKEKDSCADEKSEEEEQPKKKKSKKDKEKDSCVKDEEMSSKKTEDKPKAKPLLGFVKASSS